MWTISFLYATSTSTEARKKNPESRSPSCICRVLFISQQAFLETSKNKKSINIVPDSSLWTVHIHVAFCLVQSSPLNYFQIQIPGGSCRPIRSPPTWHSSRALPSHYITLSDNHPDSVHPSTTLLGLREHNDLPSPLPRTVIQIPYINISIFIQNLANFLICQSSLQENTSAYFSDTCIE